MNTNKTIEEKIKELLPKKKPQKLWNTCESKEDWAEASEAYGYNQALSDIITTLKGEDNE